MPGSDHPALGCVSRPTTNASTTAAGTQAVAADIFCQEWRERAICLNEAEEAEPPLEGKAEAEGAEECTNVKYAGTIFGQRARHKASLVPRPLAVPCEEATDDIRLDVRGFKDTVARLDLYQSVSSPLKPKPGMIYPVFPITGSLQPSCSP